MTTTSFQKLNESDSTKTLSQIRETWSSPLAIHETDLRTPQKAALYACLSYENDISTEPVTLCLPTGTGKTGVIGSLIFKGQDLKTLIIVPSDSLRVQIAKDIFKVEKYKKWSIITEDALAPNVLLMTGGFRDLKDLPELEAAHLVVTTAQSLMATEESLLESFFKQFKRVIFDEAHHTEAAQWVKFRELAKLNASKIYQFTATPYRLDNKKIQGKLIYRYSLQQAFQDGLFSKIDFIPVEEFYDEMADPAIAVKALTILEEDIANKYDHILMVRASTKEQAKRLEKIYKTLTTRKIDRIDSDTSAKKKEEILNNLKSGKTQIIICVEMLGEGYDLPSLKICALHGLRKSMPSFFQLIGRFARVSKELNLSNAKIIANIVDENIISEFNELFKIDSDWNSIIHGLNESKLENEYFGSVIAQDIKDHNLKNLIERNEIQIKCSAQAYHYFDDIDTLFSDDALKRFLEKNYDDYVLETLPSQSLGFILTKKTDRVGWSDQSTFSDLTWDVFIIYIHDKVAFIHSGNKDAVNMLAKVCKLSQIKGGNIFRILGDLDLAVYANLGLLNNHTDANYIMYTGRNVFNALSDIEKNNLSASNMFGHGYVNGIKTSIGCSSKGVFWSMRTVRVIEWMEWCKKSIAKINDPSISIESITKGMMKYKQITDFKDTEIADVTPYKFYKKTPENLKIKIFSTYVNPDSTRTRRKINIDTFDVSFNSFEQEIIYFTVSLILQGYDFKEYNIFCSWDFNNSFKIIDRSDLNEFNVEFEATDTYFLEDLSLSAWTTNFEFILLNEKLKFTPNLDFQLDENNIKVIDWNGIDINVESWNYGNNKNSVQGKIIELISNKAHKPKILFYDDGAHELADLIEFQVDDLKHTLEITLYHCKYADKKDSGTRITSVTELIQQSISSVARLSCLEKSLVNLRRRENKVSRDGKTKFVPGFGNMSDLNALIKKLRNYTITTKVCLVQPSLSKEQLNERVRSSLMSVSSILKKTVNAQTYFYISK